MGFFSGKKNSGAGNGAITSIIGSEMNINGDVKYEGKVRVDGTISGNVEGEHFILGEEGKIIGDITAQSIVCHGHIEGNLKVKEVWIKETAVVKGGIEAELLSIEAGALVEGPVKCGEAKKVVPGDFSSRSDEKVAAA